MNVDVDGSDLIGTVLAQTRGILSRVVDALDAQAMPAAVPWWGWALLLVLMVSRMRPLSSPWRRRDPVRWFDALQSAAGRDRAGGQCEYTERFVPWRRCSRPAQESDHFFPWARGGATTVENLVAACTAHNQAKGGRAPSAITRWVIARRRRAYFPAHQTRTPGAWYRRRRR